MQMSWMLRIQSLQGPSTHQERVKDPAVAKGGDSSSKRLELQKHQLH